MQKLIFTLLIIINLKITKLYAITKIIYYCETKEHQNSIDFKIGYFDRPCDTVMFDKKFIIQKILLLKNYNKSYKIYNYEKQQVCNKISEQIQQIEKLLIINKNNKILLNKLKRKLSRYKKLKQKNCPSYGFRQEQ